MHDKFSDQLNPAESPPPKDSGGLPQFLGDERGLNYPQYGDKRWSVSRILEKNTSTRPIQAAGTRVAGAGGGDEHRNRDTRHCCENDTDTRILPEKPSDPGELKPGEKHPSFLIHRTKEPDACHIRTYERSYFSRIERQWRSRNDVHQTVSHIAQIDVQRSKRPAHRRLVHALTECGSHMEYREYFTHPDRPLVAQKANFCKKHLLCPGCAMRRAAKMLRAYVPRITQLIIEQNLMPYMVTLTARNHDDLAGAYDRVQSALRSIMKDAGRARRGELKRYHPFACSAATTSSVEFKRGKNSGAWHPHVHMLILCDSSPNIDAIKREWCHVIKNAEPAAQDVRPVHSFAMFDDPDLTEQQAIDLVANDALEVFKYPLKFAGLSPSDRYQAFQVFSHKRLIRTWGLIRGVQLKDSFIDQPVDYHDYPYVKHLFNWSRYYKSYYHTTEKCLSDSHYDQIPETIYD